jgi:hypothetical protein
MKFKVLAVILAAALTAPVVAAPVHADIDQGELVVAINEVAGREEIQAWVKLRGTARRIDAATLPAHARTGDIVTVDGDAVVKTVKAKPDAVSAASLGDTAGVRRVLVIVASNTTYPAATTEAAAATLLGDLNTYFTAASNGKMAITGEVRSMNLASIGCNSFFEIIQEIAQQVPVQNYHHIVTITAAACGAGGMGTLGGRDTVIFGPPSVLVAAHEIGHNLGLEHAGSLACANNSVLVTLAADIANQCAFSEYGDVSDAMGGYSPGFFSARRAFSLGWLEPNQVLVNPQGRITLAPYGTPGAVTAAFLGDGAGGETWIEYRTSSAGTPMAPDGQVQLRWAQREPRDQTINAATTVLLDLTPGSRGATDLLGALDWSFSDAGLHTSTQSAVLNDIRVALISKDANAAVIEITGGDTTNSRYRTTWLTIDQRRRVVAAAWDSHPASRVLGLSGYLVEIVDAGGNVVASKLAMSEDANFAAPRAGRYTLRVTPQFSNGPGAPETLAFAVGKDRTVIPYPLGHGNKITVAEEVKGLSVKLPAVADVAHYDVMITDSDTGAVALQERATAGLVTAAGLDPRRSYFVTVDATFGGGATLAGVHVQTARPRTLGPRVRATVRGKNVTVTFTVPSKQRSTCTQRPRRCVPAVAKVQLSNGTTWKSTNVKVPANGRVKATIARGKAVAVRVAIGRSLSEPRLLK